MQFHSTRGRSPAVSFRDALFAGLAPDGGLYVPEALDPFPFEKFRGASVIDLGTEIAARFVGDDIPRAQLTRLLASALDFPLPLVPVSDDVSALELFHGPTFAFKDVGARVMARLMAQLAGDDRTLTILVATSGDTGSAVAQAFFELAGTRVVVLFPKEGVTPVQEAQFTTLGGNVTAVAVAGTFDDCQRLVKESFVDQELGRRTGLTSANSINIGRLLPQVFYYAHAALQGRRPALFSIPSGNFGNLTAGLWAWKLGAPIRGLVAATTINDTVPRYVATGRYEPRPSVPTLANAMDVGNPSNAERIRFLFNDDVEALRAVVSTAVHTDAEVRLAIRDIWNRHGYIAEPHSAIGYLGLASRVEGGEAARVFLATAHPAKFRDTIEPVIGESVPLPPALEAALERPRHVEQIRPELDELRPLLYDSP